MLEQLLLRELEEYIDKHTICFDLKVNETKNYYEKCYSLVRPVELEDFIENNRKAAFNKVLFSFIDKKEVSDSDIYKKAGIDRRHFSKIRSNPDYRIGKITVIALALALELNKKETNKLLSAAGYSLSDSDTFDLIIQFFLEKKIYDIHTLNQALDYFSLKPLSATLE
ncbi:MAG: hypothetical protein CVU87_12525 [Firmicutes bacterium HGW-Firmicutes-12]|nr:MAG: hypothetical protein CVU87_12525 [Firmicutes bacterium HGW-Firmicutes-12]